MASEQAEIAANLERLRQLVTELEGLAGDSAERRLYVSGCTRKSTPPKRRPARSPHTTTQAPLPALPPDLQNVLRRRSAGLDVAKFSLRLFMAPTREWGGKGVGGDAAHGPICPLDAHEV